MTLAWVGRVATSLGSEGAESRDGSWVSRVGRGNQLLGGVIGGPNILAASSRVATQVPAPLCAVKQEEASASLGDRWNSELTTVLAYLPSSQYVPSVS